MRFYQTKKNLTFFVTACLPSTLNTDAIPMIVLAMTFKLPLFKLFSKGDWGLFVNKSFIKLLAKF